MFGWNGLSGVLGRCTSVSITGGLTLACARFERVIMEFACTRQFSLSRTPCMDDCTPVELRMEELIGVWRGVAIVTGDGCPHESLAMNDPPTPHRHTHRNPCCQHHPFPHTHIQKQVHLQILPSVVLYGAAAFAVDTTVLFLALLSTFMKCYLFMVCYNFNGIIRTSQQLFSHTNRSPDRTTLLSTGFKILHYLSPLLICAPVECYFKAFSSTSNKFYLYISRWPHIETDNVWKYIVRNTELRKKNDGAHQRVGNYKMHTKCYLNNLKESGRLKKRKIVGWIISD